MSIKKVSDYHYLIVGGTTKAATTSLYTYLTDHPSICGATYKETRFFLDTEYPLPSKYRFKGDVTEYNELFTHCHDEQIRLDTTPDYLYCSSALERIAEYLPNVKLIFSLREPISRLISWYRFARQIGKLPQSMDFDQYVDQLFNYKDIEKELPSQNGNSQGDLSESVDINPADKTKTIQEGPTSEQHWLALKQGCYATYLKKYIERFGYNRIHSLFYEDLATEPLHVLHGICDFAVIDKTFFNDYTFKVTNRTESMRNTELHQKYRALRFKVRKWTHNKPFIHNTFRSMRRTIEPLYLRINTRSDEKITVSQENQKRLIDYYKQDVSDLQVLIGKQPPWQQYFTENSHE
ncbi:MAG: sulfotransferase domain-containing protein [Candidatus Poribacteria bacterium]|nr:sulfotransferase domain-containing protein [Candidatus Poribacteria bacterium]